MAAAKPITAQDVAVQILGGRFDDELGMLVDTIGERAAVTQTTTTWALDVDGIVIAEDDMTIAMYEYVERKAYTPAGGVRGEAMKERASLMRAVLESALIFAESGVATPEAVDAAQERVGRLKASDITKGTTLTQVPFVAP